MRPPACPRQAASGGPDPWPKSFRVREEKLLAADLVLGNSPLAFPRNQPVDESLAHFLLDVRMSRRVDQDHPVLVEQTLVALHRNHQLAAILEGQPGAPVR